LGIKDLSGIPDARGLQPQLGKFSSLPAGFSGCSLAVGPDRDQSENVKFLVRMLQQARKMLYPAGVPEAKDDPLMGDSPVVAFATENGRGLRLEA
jgi:hypothetical protein